MMDILLITPPIFGPATHLMANPLLLSVLKKQGFVAHHLDLNFNFQQKTIYEYIKKNKMPNTKRRLSPGHIRKTRVDFLSWYLKSLPRADYYEITEIFEEEALLQQAELFKPNIVTYHHLVRNNFPKFIELIDDKIHNPFLFFYKKKIFRTIKRYCPKAVGISLTSPSQFLSSLTIASLLRKELPKCHIIFGGAYVTCYHDEFAHNKQINPLWDTLITGEGESPLIALLECLKNSNASDFARVPNLTYKEKKSFEPKFSNATSFENINELPTPSYPKLNSNDKSTTFFIQASRSCYWGKCRYCAHLSNVYPKYRIRNPKNIVRDIVILQKRHKVSSFWFVDVSFSPLMMKQVSNQIISSGIKVEKLCCLSRLEKEFSYKLFSLAFRAGFRRINFGLETVNARLSKIIHKGYHDIKESDRIINDAHRAGVIPAVHAIFGLPTEREQETMETYNFLKERIKICTPIVEVFRLEKNTFFWKNPDKFGIEIIKDDNLELFNNSFRYRHSDPKAISFERALQLRYQFYQEVSGNLGGTKKNKLC